MKYIWAIIFIFNCLLLKHSNYTWNKLKIVTPASDSTTTSWMPTADIKYASIVLRITGIPINVQNVKLSIHPKGQEHHFFHLREMYLMSIRKEVLKLRRVSLKLSVRLLLCMVLPVAKATISQLLGGRKSKLKWTHYLW